MIAVIVALALCVCFVSLTAFFLLRMGGGGGGAGGAPARNPGPGKPLPLPAGLKSGTAPWYIRQVRNPTQVSFEQGAMRYDFNKGKAGNQSGPSIYANPFRSLPAESATLSFNLFLPANWDFVKAGKLLGMAIGTKPGEHASGGEWSPTAASFRLMWHVDGKLDSAILKAYVYLAIKGGAAGAYAPQGPQTKAVMNDDDRTGYSLWYKKAPTFRVYKNKWNSLSISMRLNTPGRANGMLSVTCNGVQRQVNDIIWRETANVKIYETFLTAIFGGSDTSFAPKTAQHCLFKDFKFSAAN